MADYIFSKYVNVWINITICHCMYSKLGNLKGDRFKEYTGGRKQAFEKFHEVLSHSGEDISKSKIERMQNGKMKTKFTNNEAKAIAKLFNISEDYFMIGKEQVLTIPGLSIEDWKKYLNSYKQKEDEFYLIPIEGPSEKYSIQGKVKDNLDKFLKEHRWKSLDDTNPVYRILHYFTTGNTFVGISDKARVCNVIKRFTDLKINDFLFLELEDMEKEIQGVQNKLEIMKSLVILEKSRKDEAGMK